MTGIRLAPRVDRAAAQAPLKIGVVGAGRIGDALAEHWVKAGHEVVLSSRHPENLKELAERLGPRARMIDSNVPVLSSGWSGTGTVVVPSAVRRCITTWLPRRRTSTKPCHSRMRHTSRPDTDAKSTHSMLRTV
ncbi:MAG: NAD(P)-binding domain-containing protein [Candidatus Rokubacteria bacterium]|nr:NAD(P)-binding domain-containing protein [Candidatus Rokubacteria bacterium]